MRNERTKAHDGFGRGRKWEREREREGQRKEKKSDRQTNKLCVLQDRRQQVSISSYPESTRLQLGVEKAEILSSAKLSIRGNAN